MLAARSNIFGIFCLLFSFLSHSHLIRILNVTVGFLFLLYLVLFCFTCSFSDLACINLLVYFVLPCLFFYTSLCLFYIPCVFFTQKLFQKKDTTSVSLALFRVGHNYYCLFIFVFISSFSRVNGVHAQKTATLLISRIAVGYVKMFSKRLIEK